jgi:hypothetical protein
MSGPRRVITSGSKSPGVGDLVYQRIAGKKIAHLFLTRHHRSAGQHVINEPALPIGPSPVASIMPPARHRVSCHRVDDGARCRASRKQRATSRPQSQQCGIAISERAMKSPFRFQAEDDVQIDDIGARPLLRPKPKRRSERSHAIVATLEHEQHDAVDSGGDVRCVGHAPNIADAPRVVCCAALGRRLLIRLTKGCTEDLMTIQIERLRKEIRTDTLKFVVRMVIVLGAAVAVGVAIGRFW